MYSLNASAFANLQSLVILVTLGFLIACTLLMKPQPLRAAFAGDHEILQGVPAALTK